MYRTYITMHMFSLFLLIIGNLFDAQLTTQTSVSGLIHICKHEKSKEVIAPSCASPSTCNHHGVLNRALAFLHMTSKWGGNEKAKKRYGKKRKWKVEFERIGRQTDNSKSKFRTTVCD